MVDVLSLFHIILVISVSVLAVPSLAFSPPLAGTRVVVPKQFPDLVYARNVRCFESLNNNNNQDPGPPGSPPIGSSHTPPENSIVAIDNWDRLKNTAILMAPATMSILAFFSYKETSEFFHAFVDVASGHTWAPVDGGAYLTELITPALNGPVANFISLLFGTLTSMTVGNLYQRKNTMARVLGDLLEDLRLMELNIQYFPQDYQKSAQELIDAYTKSLLNNLNDEHSNEALNKNREFGRLILEKLMLLFHDMTEDPNAKVNGRVMDQSYDTLIRMIQSRNTLISTHENAFPIWHYGNLSILALAICFIFLVLTDKTALLFLGGFQLRMCWAMLIGTFSMLAIVLYDLNFPLSGAFQIVRPMRMSGFPLDKYVELVNNAEGDTVDLDSGIDI